MSEGPVDEANFVDYWLEKRPRTPIAPFLHLFKAHRLRAGFEAARAKHEKALMPTLVKRYREALDKARYPVEPQEVEEIQRFGRGALIIENLSFNKLLTVARS